MIVRWFTVALLVVGMAVSGCTKTEPAGPSLGASRSVVTGSFRGRIDSQDFLCNNEANPGKELPPSFSVFTGADPLISELTIEGWCFITMTDRLVMTLVAVVDTTAGRVYEIGSSGGAALVVTVKRSGGGYGVFRSDDRNPVRLIMDHADPASRTYRGHFSGTLYNRDPTATWRSIVVEGGTFDVQYTKVP